MCPREYFEVVLFYIKSPVRPLKYNVGIIFLIWKTKNEDILSVAVPLFHVTAVAVPLFHVTAFPGNSLSFYEC